MSETLPQCRPKILFIHRVNGAQFEFFGAWLAQQGWDVLFLSDASSPESGPVEGTRSALYTSAQSKRPVSDYLWVLEFSANNAFGTLEAMTRLRAFENYHPDIVIAHAGWGVGLCVKQVWPSCFYIVYHEWYYTNMNWENGGKPEAPFTTPLQIDARTRNMVISAEFDTANAHWCPTKFQASRFPPALRKQISVVPDGVDCKGLAPAFGAPAKLDFDWLSLPEGTPIVTYMTRGLEPIRGFPQFMKALQRLQEIRDDFHTVIIGMDRSFYQINNGDEDTWRIKMIDELNIDQSRVHFQSTRTRQEFNRLLHASSVHCYFTEPFVTSWSLFEAMAAGCLVIGSDCGSVREVISDMKNGILVDMDDTEEVSEMLNWGLSNPKAAARLRKNARETILKRYDAAHVFPQKEKLLRQLVWPGSPVSTPSE